MMKPVEAKHVLEAIPYRAPKELDTIADVVLRYRLRYLLARRYEYLQLVAIGPPGTKETGE